MSEDIIRSDRPHEVVMTEGSNIAVGKTGEKTEPSVRKVFQEGEEFVDAQIILEEGADNALNENVEAGASAPDIRNGDDTASAEPDIRSDVIAKAESLRIDNQNAEASLIRAATKIEISQPEVKAEKSSVLENSTISSEDTLKTEASVDTTEEAVVMPYSAFMPDMDFPARVINLKISNDQLRDRLDKLE